MNGTVRARATAVLERVVPVAGCAVVWQAVATLADQRYLPPLTDIAYAVGGMLTGPQLGGDIMPSLARALAGLVIGGVIGIVAGLSIGASEALRGFTAYVVEFTRAVPISAMLSAAILVLGTGTRMRVSLIAVACLFPVLLNTIDAARRVDQERLDTARALRVSRPRIVVRVLLPSALPAIFAGLRISLAYSLIAMVISEMVAAQNGLGSLIFQSQRLFRVTDTYAGVFLIGAVGWCLTAALTALERRAVPWHFAMRAQQ